MGALDQILASIDNAKRVVGRNAQDLVSDPAAYADKIVGHLRNTNAGVAPVAAGGELTNRPRSMEERVDDTVNSVDFGGGLGVIKPKGGNWLSGKYGPEAQLRSLRRSLPDPELDGTLRPEVAAQYAGLNSFVDNQLTKYVKNDMGAPTDPIRKMADAWQGEKATKLEQAEAKVKALRAKQEAQAATRGVPEEYLTRTRQDVLAAEEARDLIAENTGLHFNIEQRPDFQGAVQAKRRHAGFPEEGMAATDIGKNWEHYTDTNLGTRPVADFQTPGNLQADPWLAKANPNADVNYLAPRTQDMLGLSHLTDELSNSLFEGRLSPEQLAKMPIDQAVKHVAEINALRSVTAKKAQAMEVQGMPLHKDYPDQGMSWRQLQHEDEPTLQKWLTQEGDAMGHCVGGYCPDVKEGRSNIYSLRDAKGQPHVTIETQPYNYIDALGNGDEAAAEIYDQIGERLTGVKSPTSGNMDFDAWVAAVDPIHDDILAEMGKHYAANPPVHPDIVQIKGKNNKAPSAEHLPFIQDFIRSGKWSDVQDLKNAGMYKVGDQYMTKDELQSILGRRTPDGRPVVDQLGEDVMRTWQRDVIDYGDDRI